MNTVSVRPRLDLRYDVIQSVFPQLLGVRDRLDDAKALAEWACGRIAPCRLTVYGPDGATPVEVRDVAADPSRPPRAERASH
jgi:hypothetical protein